MSHRLVLAQDGVLAEQLSDEAGFFYSAGRLLEKRTWDQMPHEAAIPK